MERGSEKHHLSYHLIKVMMKVQLEFRTISLFLCFLVISYFSDFFFFVDITAFFPIHEYHFLFSVIFNSDDSTSSFLSFSLCLSLSFYHSHSIQLSSSLFLMLSLPPYFSITLTPSLSRHLSSSCSLSTSLFFNHSYSISLYLSLSLSFSLSLYLSLSFSLIFYSRCRRRYGQLSKRAEQTESSKSSF